MTPVQVQSAVLTAVGEPEGIFHVTESVKTYIQHGEQILGMLRAITEKSVPFALSYNQSLYPVHTAMPDFIFPLRVSILKKQLFPTTLARVADANPNWAIEVGEPKKFFMVGATHIGFAPSPPSNTLSARITYLAMPPVPSDFSAYMIGQEWHEALIHYASAILLAKEHKYGEATMHIQAFIEKAGVTKDPRFGPAETKGNASLFPLHPSSEAVIG